MTLLLTANLNVTRRVMLEGETKFIQQIFCDTRLKFNDSNNWLLGKAMCALLMMCMVTAQEQRGVHPPPEATSWPLSHTKEKAHKKQILLGSTRTFRHRPKDIHPL
ncbi:uncharacterized protein ACIQIH_007895 isoform 2-T3 [Cyanocitta cristata]